MPYIYLIAKKENDEETYKIGFTRKDPQRLKRLKQLQTGNDSDLIVVDQYESEFAIMIETAMHNMLRHKNKRGEWFYLTPELVNSFQDNCKTIEKNFQFLRNENEYFKKKHDL